MTLASYRLSFALSRSLQLIFLNELKKDNIGNPEFDTDVVFDSLNICHSKRLISTKQFTILHEVFVVHPRLGVNYILAFLLNIFLEVRQGVLKLNSGCPCR